MFLYKYRCDAIFQHTITHIRSQHIKPSEYRSYAMDGLCVYCECSMFGSFSSFMSVCLSVLYMLGLILSHTIDILLLVFMWMWHETVFVRYVFHQQHFHFVYHFYVQPDHAFSECSTIYTHIHNYRLLGTLYNICMRILHFILSWKHILFSPEKNTMKFIELDEKEE